MRWFAIELGQVFKLEKLLDVLCADVGDDGDERVEPRAIDLDVDVRLKVDGNVGVQVLVSYGLVLVPHGLENVSVWEDHVYWSALTAQARS